GSADAARCAKYNGKKLALRLIEKYPGGIIWRASEAPRAAAYRFRLSSRRPVPERTKPLASRQVDDQPRNENIIAKRRRNALPAREVTMLSEIEGDIGSIAAIGPVGDPLASKYERLVARAKQVPPATTVVASPCDEGRLRGPIEAAKAGIIVPGLVGPAQKIRAVAREHNLDISQYQIVD